MITNELAVGGTPSTLAWQSGPRSINGWWGARGRMLDLSPAFL